MIEIQVTSRCDDCGKYKRQTHYMAGDMVEGQDLYEYLVPWGWHVTVDGTALCPRCAPVLTSDPYGVFLETLPDD